jgi:hypothetical protein
MRSLCNLGSLIIPNPGIQSRDKHQGFIQELGDAFFVGGYAAYAVFDEGRACVG